MKTRSHTKSKKLLVMEAWKAVAKLFGVNKLCWQGYPNNYAITDDRDFQIMAFMLKHKQGQSYQVRHAILAQHGELALVDVDGIALELARA